MGDGAEGIRKVAALHFPGAIGMVDLPIYWIRSDFLPMIITAALTLTCGSVADLLLRMITIRLKDLPTAAATTILHLGGSGREWQGLILSGSTLKLDTNPDNYHR